MFRISHIAAISLVGLTLTPTADAIDAQVTVERNDRQAASETFRFPTFPAPSKVDAAAAGKVRLVSGQADDNSGGARKLIDGALPRTEDDPQSNFFFQASRSEGSSRSGRLLLTLSELTTVTSIVSYSWHSDVRGPQVYTLYGDGGNEMAALPDRSRPDPTAGGWIKIAAVDTRPHSTAPGGQYAVKISGRDGDLGRHKRLLFDVERTGADSPFAQTFFSEIDVLDGKEYQPAAPVVAEIDWFDIGDKYRIGFDTSDAPDLKPWVDEKLKPVCAAWYPQIVDLLSSDGFNAPEKFTITFHEDMEGIAHCSGTSIHCAARWYRTQLEGEALGSVVHEMVHVVQQYWRPGSGRRNPSWLVEGLADYIRWHLYEPASLRRPPNPKTAKYTDSYRTTGAFLAYVVDKKGPEVITRFNAAMRNGTYTANSWTDVAGANVDTLWADYIKTLESK